MGAATNAATSKESTHLHARLLDEHTEEAFELLAEMLLAPVAARRTRSTPSARSCSRRSRCTRTSPRTASTTCSPSRRSTATTRWGAGCSGDAEVIGSIPVPEIASYHDARYTAANIVVAAAGHLEHEQIVELARAVLQRAGGRAQRRPAATGSDDAVAALRASRPRRPSSTTSASAARGSRAPTSDASRWAFSTRSSAARPRRGCFARCARSAGSPTRSAPTASSTWIAAWSRCTSAPARTTSREACEIIGRELGVASRPRRQRRGAGARQGARQGTDGARAGGDRRADVAAGPRDPVRRPAALARRDARAGRAGERRGRRRAGRASSTTPSGSRPPASAPTRSSFRRAAALGQSRRWQHQRDPGRPVSGRRRADGGDRLRGRRRRPTTSSSPAAPTRRSAAELARGSGRRGRRGRLHDPGGGARQRPRVPRRRRPCRGRHHRVRPRVGSARTPRRRPRDGSAPGSSWRPTSRSAPC